MTDAERHHEREILREAFTAGWQAGLAVNITSPRVLAVIESCFDLWLREALDEADVLGLSFRSRQDLPGPSWRLNGKVVDVDTGKQPWVLSDDQDGSSVA